MSKASRLARRIRLYGPPSRMERFLMWKSGPISTECMAYCVIIALVYINIQMILAIYAEKSNIDSTPQLHIDLGVNPIAAQEKSVRSDNKVEVVNNAVQSRVQEEPAKAISNVNVEGVQITKELCPLIPKCPEEHVHIYAEGGHRKSKVCLNGKEVLPAWQTGRGLNLVVINPERGSAGSVHHFDTYSNPGIDLVDTLNEVNEGRIVVVTSQDEASAALSPMARRSLEKLGSTLIHDLGWRNSWALIGQVGLSSITPFEVMKYPLDKSIWAEPVALSSCVPYKIDSEDIMKKMREDFCAIYDNYGTFCSNSWIRPSTITLPHPPVATQYPIAIIAGNRGAYLRQVLTSLFAVPGLNPGNIIVFQDGYGEETFTIVRQFGVRLGRFPQTISNNHEEDTFNHADHITVNYKRALDAVWTIHSDSDFCIVLEDDLIVGPDLLDYFSQLVPVLEKDSTLFSVSAWNDNGYQHSSSDPTTVYRTEFFPGLGWLLPKKRWYEFVGPGWPKCCNGHSWDLYLRQVLENKGLDSLYPDVSRTFHIGKVGANVFSDFFNGYFRKHTLTTEPHYQLKYLDMLGTQSYSELISNEITTAVPVDHTKDPCGQGFINEGNQTLVIYYYQRNNRDHNQVLGICGCLRIWNVDRVRGLFNSVLRTHFRGNRIFIVGSMSKYAKESMPKDIIPFKISKYKDEKE